MTHIPLELYDAMARADLPTFVARAMQALEPGNPYEENWHVHLITRHLERRAPRSQDEADAQHAAA